MQPSPGRGVPDYEPLVLHREARFEVVLLQNQRPRVVVKGPWEDHIGAYMAEHGLTDLSLNTGVGWDGGGVGFLEGFSGLRSLAILDWRTTDLRPILRHAATLEELIVECKPEHICSLGQLPALRTVRLDWQPGWEGFFDGGGRSLRALGIERWPYPDLAHLSPLEGLEEFVVIGSRPLRDITGLGKRVGLRELVLIQCDSIADFEAIADCRKLTRLELRCKPLQDIRLAGKLPGIERLSLGRNAIPTVQPLTACRELRRFSTRGRVLDGDLSVFLELPEFEWLTIEGGGRYKPSIAEINRRCGHRYRE